MSPKIKVALDVVFRGIFVSRLVQHVLTWNLVHMKKMTAELAVKSVSAWQWQFMNSDIKLNDYYDNSASSVLKLLQLEGKKV